MTQRSLTRRGCVGVRPSGRRLSGGRPATHRGAVLTVVLVCVAIASALAFSLVRGAVAIQRQLLFEEESMQVDWLLQGAFDRALDRFQSDVEYQGERWELSSADLAREARAAVTISLASAPDGADARILEIAVVYTTDSQQTIHRTRTARWTKAPAVSVTSEEL